MKVGDILTGSQLDELPVGSVVVHDEPDGAGFNTVTRAASGYSWYSQRRSGAGHHDQYDLGEIIVGDWTVVHVPAAPALKVGDTITSEEQARALPVGSVVVDTKDAAPHSAPALKVGDDKWLFDGVLPPGSQHCPDADVYGGGGVVVVYIPSADTGAIRTAA